MLGQHAHQHLDLEWHVAGTVHLQVVSGEPVALQMLPQLFLEAGVDGTPTEAIDREEDRVPAPRPADSGRGALHLGVALGDLGVVLGRDGAFLDAEGARGILTHPFDALRLDPALRRQGVANEPDARLGGNDVRQRVRAHVAPEAVAHAIPGGEPGTPRGTQPERVVAEAHVGATVRLHLGHEVVAGGSAAQQITPGAPGLDAFAVVEPYLGQAIPQGPAQAGGGGRKEQLLATRCEGSFLHVGHGLGDRAPLESRSETRQHRLGLLSTTVLAHPRDRILIGHGPEVLTLDSPPVVRQHDVAAGDAHVLDVLFSMLLVRSGGDAKGERKSVLRVPLDLGDRGDRRGVERILGATNLRKSHRMSVTGIGVFGLAGTGT
jgi:hypothetical protein